MNKFFEKYAEYLINMVLGMICCFVMLVPFGISALIFYLLEVIFGIEINLLWGIIPSIILAIIICIVILPLTTDKPKYNKLLKHADKSCIVKTETGYIGYLIKKYYNDETQKYFYCFYAINCRNLNKIENILKIITRGRDMIFNRKVKKVSSNIQVFSNFGFKEYENDFDFANDVNDPKYAMKHILEIDQKDFNGKKILITTNWKYKGKAENIKAEIIF